MKLKIFALTMFCSSSAFAFKHSPFHSKLLRTACEERNLSALQTLLQEGYDPYQGSALEVASSNGFFAGVKEILKFSPPSFSDCDDEQRKQIVAAMANLSRIGSSGSRSKKTLEVSELLKYIGEKEDLSAREELFLTRLMDLAGIASEIELLTLFLDFGLKARDVAKYNISGESLVLVESMLAAEQKEAVGLWVWVEKEVEKRRVSRAYFPGAVTAGSVNSKRGGFQPFDPIFDAILLGPQLFSSVLGLKKLRSSRDARRQAKVIAWSLVKGGLLKAPINLPRSVGSVGMYNSIRSYPVENLEQTFQSYRKRIKDAFDLDLRFETLQPLILDVAVEMKYKGEYYDAKAFDNAVIQKMASSSENSRLLQERFEGTAKNWSE